MLGLLIIRCSSNEASDSNYYRVILLSSERQKVFLYFHASPFLGCFDVQKHEQG